MGIGLSEVKEVIDSNHHKRKVLLHFYYKITTFED